MTKFYVYILEREDGTPFYVGKGSGDRVRHHVNEAKRHAGINPHKERIIRKMLKAGAEPSYRIDSYHEEEKDAHDREIELIAKIGRHNLGTGPLTNLTAGGDGIVGNVLSDETKKAISDFMKARFRTPEMREWARQNLAKQKTDPAFHEAILRHVYSDDFQAARRAGHEAKMSDPAYIAQAAERTRQQWEDPEFREVHAERIRQMGRDPKNLEINSRAARDRHAAGVYDSKKRPVMVEGKPYSSITEAAIAIGIKYDALRARFGRYEKKGVFPQGYAFLDKEARAA